VLCCAREAVRRPELSRHGKPEPHRH